MTMKIYECKSAPNPRRVRIFLAEKGIAMNYVELDIAKGGKSQPSHAHTEPEHQGALLRA